MSCTVIVFAVAIVCHADCVVVAFQKSVSFKSVYSDHTGFSSSSESVCSFLGPLPLHPSTGQGMDSFGFDSSLSPMYSDLKAQSLFRSPSPPGSGSVSSGTSSGAAGVASFAQQSYQIEAHRRAVWNAFCRRVFSARNMYLADVALLDSQTTSIFFMDPSIVV